MSVRGITLVKGTVVVLDLDGTLCFIEDVQPTHAAVVALPEQLPERKDTQVFTPGRVGAKKISPFSSASRTLKLEELTERNREFIDTFQALRSAHGPIYVARTAEEEAAMAVIKETGSKRRRGKSDDAAVEAAGVARAARGTGDRAQRRAARKAAKVPCVKCKELPVHITHHNGTCAYEAPEKKGRGARVVSGAKEPAGGRTYKVLNADITALQSSNDKFAQGNRFYRVFIVLGGLGEATLAQVIAGLATDNGKPMTNPEKVARRALKALVDAGNVAVS